jgi:hypothetical protein
LAQWYDSWPNAGMDGDIDYSRFSRAQLEDALTRVDRARYPRNYENLRRELDARAPEPHQVARAPSIAVLVGCYAGAFLLVQGLANLLLTSALVVILREPSQFRGGATPMQLAVFAAFAVGMYVHLSRNFPGQFAGVAIGVALVISALNAIGSIFGPFGLTPNPMIAFAGMLVLTLLAAVVGRILSAAIGSRAAPSNNRWRGP